jgi:hypothetical protein
MENFHFSISDRLSIFDTDKAITLVFNSRTVKKSTYAEESGLFSHLFTSTLKKLNQIMIKQFIKTAVKLSQEQS